jgi:hypothetical protein
MTASRSLLERAAKAAGIVVVHNATRPVCAEDDDLIIESGTGGHTVWNPRKWDGDALRLAVKLQLNIIQRYRFDPEPVAVAVGFGFEDLDNSETYYEGDPYAATRLAIVRAAASMVKE